MYTWILKDTICGIVDTDNRAEEAPRQYYSALES